MRIRQRHGRSTAAAPPVGASFQFQPTQDTSASPSQPPRPPPGPVSPAVPGQLTGVADGARVPRVAAVAVELLRRLRTHAAVLAGVRVTPVLHVTCIDQDVLRLHQVLWQQNGVSNGGGVGRVQVVVIGCKMTWKW